MSDLQSGSDAVFRQKRIFPSAAGTWIERSVLSAARPVYAEQLPS